MSAQIEIPAGGTIWSATEFALNKAKHLGHDVSFVINGIKLSVSPDSYIPDIVKIYNLKLDIDRAGFGD